MGTFTFKHPVEVGGLQEWRFKRLGALVKTGATYSVVPVALLRRLGLEELRWSSFTLVDARRVEKVLGQTRVRLDGESAVPLILGGVGHGGV